MPQMSTIDDVTTTIKNNDNHCLRSINKILKFVVFTMLLLQFILLSIESVRYFTTAWNFDPFYTIISVYSILVIAYGLIIYYDTLLCNKIASGKGVLAFTIFEITFFAALIAYHIMNLLPVVIKYFMPNS